mmetsp:Transcript_16855/g.42107  ORF Transcript_16855/g.42107 Transcript_16855/m.42107 type:complete len:135 (-) Transcript_16855:291-695(-)
MFALYNAKKLSMRKIQGHSLDKHHQTIGITRRFFCQFVSAHRSLVCFSRNCFVSQQPQDGVNHTSVYCLQSFGKNPHISALYALLVLCRMRRDTPRKRNSNMSDLSHRKHCIEPSLHLIMLLITFFGEIQNVEN